MKDEIIEAAKDAVEMTNAVVAGVIKTPDFHTNMAKHWKMMYAACLSEGFTQDQALQLVCASLKGTGK